MLLIKSIFTRSAYILLSAKVFFAAELTYGTTPPPAGYVDELKKRKKGLCEKHCRMTLQRLFLYIAIGFVASYGSCFDAVGQSMPDADLPGIAQPPLSPGEDAWVFVDDLKSPLWKHHSWKPREAAPGEADLRSGVCIEANFPDPERLLETAYDDLSTFLSAGNVPQNNSYVVETSKAKTDAFEAYRIEVAANRCRILAADTEGIRRGIFYVEDMMLRAGGPFLPLGTLERKPFIKTRISRCFFGPIKRPPMNRDELMDDVDYYPEQYLNRLAHEGINGLWLTVTFKDLCHTSVVPEYGHDAERRLAKLRKTVEKCRRYGIRIYLFTIEPAMWNADEPALKKHPELGGAWGRAFCPWSDTSQQYLYEATKSIFSAVPHLGGMINITHGERYTNCQSTVIATSDARPKCAICAEKEPWEVLHQTLAPMAKGIRDANPNAELIAWLYMPYQAELAEWVYEIPKHMPDNVTLQFNFESGVVKEFLGKLHNGGDYWLSTPGPSRRFERIAHASRQAGGSLSAKIQTGCSHEVATVPYVPVPGLLYRKFRAMHELGVTHVMLCWYFGNYPGVMNKAAGELSFEPFPKTENEFLHQLASLKWGRNADTVVRAWKKFAEGYSNFPLTNYFQYYGPMHDGVVWPLLLQPQDTPLAPTWQIASPYTKEAYAPSGDRIGEALGPSYTLPEAIELCRRMSDQWDQGVDLLRRIEAEPDISLQQHLDIGVARALGIQFRSGLNILRFYDLRERMTQESGEKQLATLQRIRHIIEDELQGGEELIELCRRDSRLGFHSEAEGYKYYPEKIRWRMDQLRGLLDKEIPALESEIERGADVFAEYTGRTPKGPTARSLYCADIAQRLKAISKNLPDALTWQTCSQSTSAAESDAWKTRWTCCHDREALYLLFDCDDSQATPSNDSNLVLVVEPRRMWPCLNFNVASPGVGRWGVWPHCDYETHTDETENGWRGWMRISFAAMGLNSSSPGPLRINVRRIFAGQKECDWIARHPWPYRLLLSNDNPTDLGWFFFGNNPRNEATRSR